MIVTSELQSLLERYVEEHVLHGRTLDAAALCDCRPELIEPLRLLIAEYTTLTRDLDFNPTVEGPRAVPAEGLPVFEGFHTIERIGAGGMGEVFKLRDLRLDRIVAAKVLRPDAALPAGVGHSSARPARSRSSPIAASCGCSNSGRKRIRPC